MCADYQALAGRRVLVVDDSPAITSLMKEVFASCGASVFVANDGRQAMLRIQLEPYDLVLLDLKMPAPDGWQVLRFMRRVRSELVGRTILLTGDRYGQDTLRGIDTAALPAVYKPFDVSRLREVACDVLSADRPLYAA